MKQKEELLEQIRKEVYEAAIIMRGADKVREAAVVKGGHANFATEYDEKVQAFLFERLKAILPEANFLGEEDGADDFREEYKNGFLFIVDPIDGTSNFMKGYYPSTISVGLFLDGKPYIGVIYNPSSDQMYYAARGIGAYMNGSRIRTSNRTLKNSLGLFGTCPYDSYLWDQTFSLARRYMEKVIDMRRSGAASWDLCMVAGGQVGLYFEYQLRIWDYAAGVIIVEEAGGKVTQLGGAPLTYDRVLSSILARSEGVREDEIIYGDSSADKRQ